jgi:hypothetical protein
VRFGQRGIQLECLLCRRVRWWDGLLQGPRPVVGQENVGVSQPCVSQSVIRVLLDRLFEVVHRRLQIGTRALVPKISTLQIKLMRIGVLGRSRGNGVLLGTRELRFQCVGDGFCDFTFDGKNVSKLAIKGVGPKI